MSTSIDELLCSTIRARTSAPAWAWFETQCVALKDDPSERRSHIVLGSIPRRLGKADLDADPDTLATAQRLRSGWDLSGWSVDTAARVRVLRQLADTLAPGDFTERFAALCRYADVAESISYFRGLPLYPDPDALSATIGEGLRTNMRAVFEAIAHRNPVPAESFEEHRWNHMVLKALFVDSPLWPIQGLDRRANPELARILCDYAHERWAAGRRVSPELWRCVGPFAHGAMLDDLERAYRGGGRGAQAAALALSGATDALAKARYVERIERSMRDAITTGQLNWDTLSADSSGA